MQPFVLEAKGITKTYRRRGAPPIDALHDVSFGVERGSLTILTGPSGSGKSTLLAILGALETPTRGEALFFGTSLSRISEPERARLRRRIGFVFQRFHLLPRLPLWENVAYPLIPLGVGTRERFDRAQELLAAMDLTGREHSRPEELSGGEQQRVALARALIANPEVILADEPVSNLDPANADLVLERLRTLNRQGTTVVLAIHDLSLLPANTPTLPLEKGCLVTVFKSAP
jgi:putative ABC transport system ATP-binding protein